MRSSSKVSSFVPGHRKSRSDGANIFLSCSGGGSSMHSDDQGCSSRTISNAGSEERFRGAHHLLDDSLLEDPPFLMPLPPTSSSGGSDSRGCNQYDLSEKSLLTAEAKLSPQELNVDPGTKCTFQVSMWQKRYIIYSAKKNT